MIRSNRKKEYRPFANAQEFMAHPLSSDWIDCGAETFAKVLECDDDGIWLTNMSSNYFYEDAFCDLQFRDGSPFGIEVTE